MSGLAFLSLSYALQSALASAVMALVLLALRRVQAIKSEARASIFLAALLLAVVGPLLPVPQLSEAPGAAFPAIDPVEIDASAMQGPVDAPEESGSSFDGIEMSRGLANVLFALWLAGAAFQLGRQARGHLHIRRIVAASRRVYALEASYRELLPSGVEIRLSASFGPAVAGVFRPTIILPEEIAARLPAQALRAVLLHEVSHVRRHDLLAKAIQNAIEAMFWWNPAIRWMGAILDVEREVACDIRASRSCQTAADYADALLTAVTALPPQRSRLTAVLGMSSFQALERRVEGVIEERQSATATRAATAGALPVLIAISVAACAVSKPLLPTPAENQDATAVPLTAIPAVIVSPDYETPRPEIPQPAPIPVAKVEQVTVAPITRRNDATAAKEAYEDHIAALYAKHRTYVAESEAKHLDYTTVAEAGHREYIAALDAELRKHSEATELERLRFRAAMDAERREHAAATEAERREYAAASEVERMEHNRAMEAARVAYRRQLEALNQRT